MIIKKIGIRYHHKYLWDCWNCEKKRKDLLDLFCHDCDRLQNPKDLIKCRDFFEIFGIKRLYKVNEKHLILHKRKLQFLIHPDKFGTKSDNEKIYSETLSSFILKAFDTLINELLRAKYLLNLNGIILNHHDKVSNEFLMEAMELNQSIESEDNNENLLNIKNKILIKKNLYVNNLETFFDKEKAFERAKTITLQLSYIERSLESIDNKLS